MERGRSNDRLRAVPGRRALSGEEAQLWRRATADVRPMRQPRQAAAAPANPGVEFQNQPPSRPAPPASPVRPPPASPAGEPLRREAAGIDRRTLARLRRGLIAPEAQIDLHHQTQEAAHRLLDGFLAESQAAGRRCVLVITGKGYGSGGAGVLKAMVPRWLDEQPNQARVLAFCHAAPSHGGDGALYLVLRRKRASGLRRA